MRGKPAAPTAFIWTTTAVGYSTRTIPSAVYTMYGPSFATVGEVGVAKIKDMAYSAIETGDTMLLIDPATAEYTELVYIIEADAKDLIGEEAVAGWYFDNGDDTFTYKGNEMFAPGQGCWIFPGMGSVTITGEL